MFDSFLTNASTTYAYAYFGIVIALTLAEWARPRRTPADTLTLRWSNNFAIMVLDFVVLQTFFPLATIGWATLCSERGWGLMNAGSWPPAAAFLVTIVVLDFASYGQHYLLHRFSFLWRLHRTHHSDADCDFTTGVRFHPLESIFSTSVVFAVIYAVGPPAAAVFTWQILSLAATFVEHANVRIPQRIDRLVRTIFVTPDMHRIHHSQVGRESRSNMSNLFSWWDRLFGTYIDQPAAGHISMILGMQEYSDRKHATLPWMLAQPFLPETESSPTAAVATRTAR